MRQQAEKNRRDQREFHRGGPGGCCKGRNTFRRVSVGTAGDDIGNPQSAIISLQDSRK